MPEAREIAVHPTFLYALLVEKDDIPLLSVPESAGRGRRCMAVDTVYRVFDGCPEGEHNCRTERTEAAA
jgi:hypothetical protein